MVLGWLSRLAYETSEVVLRSAGVHHVSCGDVYPDGAWGDCHYSQGVVMLDSFCGCGGFLLVAVSYDVLVACPPC